jgi:hypothetical protein
MWSTNDLSLARGVEKVCLGLLLQTMIMLITRSAAHCPTCVRASRLPTRGLSLAMVHIYCLAGTWSFEPTAPSSAGVLYSTHAALTRTLATLTPGLSAWRAPAARIPRKAAGI